MKKTLILILTLVICFSVVSCVESISAENVKSASTNALESETEIETEAAGTAKDDDETGYYVTDCPGSIYPYAWQNMNAMIVTWGEASDET
ncbi:MAG: hypothetical protein LUH54_04450 [Firmicutes bacterium]|nr:hypothetical protein [Bacillota bacterium]